jgi:glyoxylase-like metal-dependent hydrolase (beta-lactamase superfamily II)
VTVAQSIARYDLFQMSHWQEVGERVWVRRYPLLDQTIGAVAGDDGLLVVDSRMSHRRGTELQAELRELAAPVRWLVNTHYHYDHCWGNSAFQAADLWAHERCPATLVARSEEWRARLIADEPAHADEYRGVVVAPPRHLFDDVAMIDLGGRTVQLSYLGRGHTDCDIVVGVPDAGVLFAGDLLENGAPPYFDDGFPLDWPVTVEALLALVAGPVVPGHGNVADRAFVEAQLADLRLVADLGRQVAAAELDLDTAAARGPYGLADSRSPIDRAAAQARGPFGWADAGFR